MPLLMEVVSLDSGYSSSTVEVEVTALDIWNNDFDTGAKARARARALVASGVMDSVTEAARNLTKGQVSRLTEVKDEREVSSDRGRKKVVYTIEVKSS